MADKQKLVVVMTAGMEDEKSSVALSIANGGISTGLEVTLFLTSSAVDWVRKGAAENAHLNPHDPPMGEMLNNFMSRGGKVYACPPCCKARGYSEGDLVEGVVVTGSGVIHEQFKQGATALTF